MGECYGGTDVMERSCAVARGIDINSTGYVTAVAAGQSQRFYSGVGIFNWCYLSSAHPDPSVPGGSVLKQGDWHIYCAVRRCINTRITPLL
jgi:hypothetical protein